MKTVWAILADRVGRSLNRPSSIVLAVGMAGSKDGPKDSFAR